MPHRRRVLGRPRIATLLFLLACGRGGDGDVAAVEEWTLSSTPTVSIGEDGTPAGEFERISTVLPLPGGEIAVVDAGALEIRVFSGAGRYQRTLGRRGEGPGEFNGITWVQLEHDTLVVSSLSQRRITMLGLDGALLATILLRPDAEALAAVPVARGADGRWFIRSLLLGAAPRLGNGPPEPGVLRDSTGFGFLAASGEGLVNLVLRLPMQPLVMGEGGIGGFSIFSAPVGVLRAGARMVVADPAAGTLQWYEPDGSTGASAVIGIPRRPLAASTVDSLRRAALDGASSPRGQAIVEAIFSSEAAPGELPVFRSALADGADRLWLEEWHYPAPTSARYQVIGADGSWQATVQMPEGFTPTAIGPDWVLGYHRDADGLQRVMRYTLHRQ